MKNPPRVRDLRDYSLSDYVPFNHTPIAPAYDSTILMLRQGKDSDPALWSTEHSHESIPTTVGEIKEFLHHMSADEIEALPPAKRQKLFRQVTHRLRIRKQKQIEEKTRWLERGETHKQLTSIFHQPLEFQRPTASSLHHLLDYDRRNVNGSFARFFIKMDCQIVLVENNWGAAVPPIKGEWRVPLPLMCWEFRISGVRVLAFTEDDGKTLPEMWIMYGHNEHWVIDDYFYVIGDPSLPAGKPHRHREGVRIDGDLVSVEFRNVAEFVYRCIRSICIMMDAQVAETNQVQASRKLSERRVKQGQAPLRDHYVVRLIDNHRRSYNNHRHTSDDHQVRTRQRGHWRIGTWVHYDDQDSGQVQYVNDGGFVVSKTWRRWHFAGDPNNIIHKEYRA